MAQDIKYKVSYFCGYRDFFFKFSDADLVGMSFCYSPNKACYIPLRHKKIKSLDSEFVIKKIKTFRGSVLKVGQNIKFDYLVLNNIK